MEFWRLYRLVYAKRWLIAGIMLIASAVIFVGATLQAQKKHYQAEAYIRPLERVFAETVGATSTQGGTPTGRISDLIMLLRTSNDLHTSAANLLRLPEGERVNKVQQILEQNGFFGQQDAVYRGQDTAVAKQYNLSLSVAQQSLQKSIQKYHRYYAEGLAKASDERGAYAPGGIRSSAEETTSLIRQSLMFEPVNGPLANDKDASLVNLILVRSNHNREAAAELYANMICVAFVDFYTAQSRTAIHAQRKDLENKLNGAEGKLKEARLKMVAYQRRPDVSPLNPEVGTAVARAVSYEGERDNLIKEIQAAKTTLNTINALRAQEPLTDKYDLPFTEDPLYRAAQGRVSQAQVNFERISTNKDVGHPDYKEALRTLNAEKKEMERLKQIGFTTSPVNPDKRSYRTLLGATKIRLDDTRSRLATVEQQLGNERAKVAKLPLAQATLADLKRIVTLYEQNVARFEQAIVEFDINAPNQDKAGTISIASQASATRIGGDPNTRWTLMAYGAILAMIFGIALVVALDALDNSIRSVGDVEKLLGLPICGVIPAQLPDPSRAPRITYLDPLSPVAESYRLLRADLLFTAEDRPFKSLMVATGKPGQGASTTICNLAITLAQAGKRVILVDADLRRPKLHDTFKTKNDVGLTSLLNDECEIEEALKATDVDNLLLLPSGPLPLNPSELLASPKMKALHERLKPHTDFILFDTPSAIAFSDAAVLSSFLDAVLMVIRANHIPRGSEQQVKALLSKAKANIIGVVLNDVNPEHVDSVHYHYHYYPILASKTSVGALHGANGNSHHNGNGHHDGVEMPLALPEAGGEPQPVAAGGTEATQAEGVAPSVGGASVGERTQAFTAPLQSRTVSEPFLEQRKKGSLKRIKMIVPFLLVAVVIALLVLVLNNSVQPQQ